MKKKLLAAKADRLLLSYALYLNTYRFSPSRKMMHFFLKT
jgi:hypothetical protein